MNLLITNPGFTSFRFMNTFGTFKIASLIIAIALVIVMYCTILKSKNKKEGFLKALVNFLTFKTFCIGKVIEILFALQFTYNIIIGCLLLFVHPLKGLLYIFVYNLVLRLFVEFIMLFVRIKENTERRCHRHFNHVETENEELNIDEEIENADTAIIVEDITDEVLEDMNQENNDNEENEDKE